MTSNEFRVIVSHPARQQSIYQWPMAMQREGVPVKFLTGLYYKSQEFPYSLVNLLPKSKRDIIIKKLLIRNMPNLNPDSVISLAGPWLEIAFRPFGLYRPWRFCHDWLAAKWIDKLALPTKPTLMHCFDGSSRTIRAAKKRGITTVLEMTISLSVYRLIAEEQSRLGLYDKVRNLSAQGGVRDLVAQIQQEADYVVGQSKFTVESLLEYGVAPGKIILQPLGVDAERFHPAPRQDHSRPFRGLFVGQLSMRKGLHHLLEAWDSLQLPNAELVLAGQATDQHGRELLHKYEGTYRLLGFVPHSELPKVYQDSDVFVFPSLAEGSANVTYEALASGLPSVVTTSSGAVARDGLEGYVIAPGEVDALKDRIQRLYHDRDLRERMGVAARRRAERYTWHHFGRRLRLMYEHICKGSSESKQILDMTER